MKLLRLYPTKSKRAEKNIRRKDYSDYYQNRLNAFGRQQMETLIKKGISVSW